jgi:predicted  nucleic acid-binding Zn-ribbon protein
MTKQNKLLK